MELERLRKRLTLIRLKTSELCKPTGLTRGAQGPRGDGGRKGSFLHLLGADGLRVPFRGGRSGMGETVNIKLRPSGGRG